MRDKLLNAAIERMQQDTDEIDAIAAAAKTLEDLDRLNRRVAEAHCHCENTITLLRMGAI